MPFAHLFLLCRHLIQIFCTNIQGDIIVFSERTYHASFGSTKGSMQISAEYGANPSNNEQISAIKKDYNDLKFSFHPVDSYVDNENPRIRRMVSKLIELGFSPTKISDL